MHFYSFFGPQMDNSQSTSIVTHIGFVEMMDSLKILIFGEVMIQMKRACPCMGIHFSTTTQQYCLPINYRFIVRNPGYNAYFTIYLCREYGRDGKAGARGSLASKSNQQFGSLSGSTVKSRNYVFKDFKRLQTIVKQFIFIIIQEFEPCLSV